MSAKPLAIVAGVGPGVGLAVAKRFAREGFRIGLLARRRAALDGFEAEIAAAGGVASGAPVDLADFAATARVIDALVAAHGPISAFVYNAAAWREAKALEITPEAFHAELALALTGALAATQAAARRMAAGGSVLWTGGGLALAPQYGGAVPALTAAKAGLRALALAIAPELAAAGLRLRTITIAGQVATGGPFDPDRIAEAFWRAHTNPDAPVETVFDGRG